jgi:hypothetical protein
VHLDAFQVLRRGSGGPGSYDAHTIAGCAGSRERTIRSGAACTAGRFLRAWHDRQHDELIDRRIPAQDHAVRAGSGFEAQRMNAASERLP